MATLYPPARRLVQQRGVLDFRQRLGSSSSPGCCETPGIVCESRALSSITALPSPRTWASQGVEVISGARDSQSGQTRRVLLQVDITTLKRSWSLYSPKACNREPILANGVQPSHCVIPIGSYLFPSCSSTTNIVCDDTTAPEVSRPRRGIPKYLGGPPNCPADSLSPRSALEICSRIALYLRSHPGCTGHGRPLLPLPLRTGLLSEA